MENDLFDLLLELETKGNKIEEVFPDSYFLDGAISMLWGIIEFEYQIKDEAKKDECAEILMDLGEGRITKAQAITKIGKLAGMSIPTSNND